MEYTLLMATIPISACIITYNEADRIGPCLESLAFCDEIVVVDSNSTDDTREIAESFGAHVIMRAFTGYRSQKDYAVSQAEHDWVLCLDADERVDTDLRTAIEDAQSLNFEGAAGYHLARLTEFFGDFLRHGSAYPDHVLRLFDRRLGGWSGEREIHESVTVDGAVKRLPGHLEHFPYRSLTDMIAKDEKYTQMMAEHLYAKGKRASLRHLLLNPFWRFVRSYILKKGFLDGWRGLVSALLSVDYARRKYVRLWLLQHGQKP